MASVSPITSIDALLIAYASESGHACFVTPELMPMIRPPASIRSAAAWATKNGARVLTANSASKIAGVVSSSPTCAVIPALLTTMSRCVELVAPQQLGVERSEQARDVAVDPEPLHVCERLTAGGLDRGRGLRRRFGVAAVVHNRRAPSPSEPLADPPADAPRAAGHQRHLACQRSPCRALSLVIATEHGDHTGVL